MGSKHAPLTPREVDRMLRTDGWSIKRKGPGDHVQYAHTEKPGKVTLDMGVPGNPDRHLAIHLQAGWMGVVAPGTRGNDDAFRTCCYA